MPLLVTTRRVTYDRDHNDNSNCNATAPGISSIITKDQLVHELEQHNDHSFTFGRFQSPTAVRRLLSGCRKPFVRVVHHVRDGRRQGNVSSTPLGSDWILAESEQVAVNCTPEQVLEAYLSGDLQTQWNRDTVLECTITAQRRRHNRKKSSCCYYQQDLVLKSQRIIRSHTGIMRYSQKISIDTFQQPQQSYNVHVEMMLPSPDECTTTTDRKPFEALSVYVSLQPDDDTTNNSNKNKNVRIYAAGFMKVNRRVVPSLLGGLFDASGIAGSMAGKGTLWLAAHFDQQQQQTMMNKKKNQQQLAAATATTSYTNVLQKGDDYFMTPLVPFNTTELSIARRRSGPRLTLGQCCFG